MTARFLTRRARLDLLEIADWVGKRSPDAADRLVDRLQAACQMLNRRPALGHVRPDLAPDRDDIRFWPVGRYLIVYRERKKGIEVVRIVSGERDLRPLLS
jgi:plasmid stabilization system protein ParE